MVKTKKKQADKPTVNDVVQMLIDVVRLRTGVKLLSVTIEWKDDEPDSFHMGVSL